MREQLNAILAHIDALRTVDTTGVEPTSHAVPQFNVMRDDEPRPCFPPEDMLANAPDRAGDFFRVPRIIEERCGRSTSSRTPIDAGRRRRARRPTPTCRGSRSS